MSFYAVRRGHYPGIYETWSECQKQIDNFKGCEYKKFLNKDDAEHFLEGNSSKNEQCLNENKLNEQLNRKIGISWFYAVNKGRKTGVYKSWAECQEQIVNYPGARFKKFNNEADAEKFADDKSSRKQSNRFDPYTTQIKGCAYYAVHRGRTTGVFETWGECQKQIVDFPQARYKKFNNKQDAEDFVISGKISASGPSSSYAASISEPEAIVYTDGCCLANGKHAACAGVGVFWGYGHANNLSEKLDGRQTNNRAEIEACCRALEQAKSLGIKRLEIRTDSQFVINSMTQWIDGWKKKGWMNSNKQEVKNKEDFQRLDQCQQGMHVLWTYVKAHYGIEGNEEADRLANEGALK